jgi:alcohol dehydrogenase (NADP+)
MAAPLLCGGVTVFGALKQYGAGTTAKDVGIIGIGGLVRTCTLSCQDRIQLLAFQGNVGVLFAKAFGANVTAISHSDTKKADSERMGATRCMWVHAFWRFGDSLLFAVIATGDGSSKHFEPFAGSIDLLLCTVG